MTQEKPVEIAIVIEGGLIQCIAANRRDVRIRVIDWDEIEADPEAKPVVDRSPEVEDADIDEFIERAVAGSRP